jgi:5-methylcytosine-specific restriction endonuclease McrA
MARIRTIKPEFWTDEKVVGLPFQARLLFIGLWNFADDTGALDYSPDRISMQIFPGDLDADITGLLDLLNVGGLIDVWVADDGSKVISVKNWTKHQKIDNPSKKTVLREDYRKVAISSEARLAVAKKYGCKPGCEAGAECYYCGLPGKIQWWNGTRGKPTKWITLSDLEFDHFQSEHSGGANTQENIVLACRSCNRAKREFQPLQFFVERNIPGALDSPREPSALDQGREGIKDQGRDLPSASPTPIRVRVSRETDLHWWMDFKLAYPDRAGDQGWRKAQRAAQARLDDGHTSDEMIEGAKRYAAFIDATGKTNTEYVKQACTFLGPDKPFLLPWKLPPTKAEVRQDKNISVSLQWLREQEAKDAAGG